MKEKDFDLIVEYGKWNIEVTDCSTNHSIILKSKPNSWLSNYYSGGSNIDDISFNIERDSTGILLYANQSVIGKVETSTYSFFGRESIIILTGEKYLFRRETLAQKFEVLNEQREVIIEIKGILDRKKQANLFGLIYFPSKLLYSVYLQKSFQDSRTTLFLLLVCGYCTELFTEIDKGE